MSGSPHQGVGVCVPRGFRAAGVAAGIKTSGAPDLALITNDGPLTHAAAVFTSNRFPAAPVQHSKAVARAGQAGAVVLNSGSANACTGKQGQRDAASMAHVTGSLQGIPPTEVLVCSTGLIGTPLPMGRVLTGITEATSRLSPAGGQAAAEAIMTTDTVPKVASYRSPHGWSIGGMAKGAGMLAPQLATMLVVLTTDAVVDAPQLDESLRYACAHSFDRLDSDGCMSTNDTVALLSSGASGVATEPDFREHLRELCLTLSRALLADAEGSTHDIAIRTRGARSEAEALTVSRAVARSNLVKTAIFGNDPNWGRIVSAIGTVPKNSAHFAPEQVEVTINGVPVFSRGQGHPGREHLTLDGRDCHIVIDLHEGDAEATLWTNDLSHAYVHENSAYST